MRFRARLAEGEKLEALLPEAFATVREAAVRVLEDDAAFNAGRGSVFTWDGRIECDAAIITATMIGTEITALTTADQYRALMGFSPDALMPSPTIMAAARMA